MPRVESAVVGEAASIFGSPQARDADPDLPASPLFDFILASQQNDGVTADVIDYIPALFEAAPDAQIIVLTGSEDGQLHRRVVAQGAKGLLQKDCSPEVLKRAIECVYGGEVWIERTMMASVLAEIAQTGSAAFSATPRPATLTKREREVIALLCEGLPNRQISARLHISETTVRRHLTTIFAKLDVSDRLELVIYAYRHGLAGSID
jgi:DNA-binding NarL/FixJ family response regulator